MKKRENVFYFFYFLTFLCLCFGFFINDHRMVFISVLTIFLFLLCLFIERILRVRFPFLLRFFIFSFIFLAEIFGEVFNFYSTVSFWDNFLHFLSGIITSCFGFSLVYVFLERCVKVKNLFLISFLFIFCFSISIGVFWEFTEFGFDRYFGFDMQKDTYVKGFNTMSLDNDDVVVSRIRGIDRTEIYVSDSVIVLDGGYLDIGLIDTMEDLFMNVVSAFIVALCGSFYIVGRKGFSFMELLRISRE